MNWQATVLTLFPEMFPGPLGLSLAGRALEKGLWTCRTEDLRQHGLGRHRAVDDTPFGGGAGMVIRLMWWMPLLLPLRHQQMCRVCILHLVGGR